MSAPLGGITDCFVTICPISCLERRAIANLRAENLPAPGIANNPAVAVTVDQVRALALTLPRTTEHLIHDRVKFRIKQIVYVAFSRDETLMGFAFPKEERQALVDSEPDKFQLPGTSDLRYNWVVARMNKLSAQEMHELVIDAWRMCVPKRVAAEHLGEQ